MSKKNDLHEKLLEESKYYTSAFRDITLSRLKLKLTATQAKYDDALSRIKQLESYLTAFDTLKNVKPPTIKIAKKTKQNQKREPSSSSAAVLVLNDWHNEEVVDGKVLEVNNSFNHDIFVARAQTAFDKAIEFVHALSNFSVIDEFHIFLLGDLLSNYLHDDLRESNTAGPMAAVINARDQIEIGLQKLIGLNRFEKIFISAVHGNHGRITAKRRHKKSFQTNLEWLLYKSMEADHLSRKLPVEWNISKTNMLRVFVKDWSIRLAHGDDIRYEGGIGGLTIPLIKAVKAWNDNAPADYTVIGHWHQFLRLWRIIVCGCLIGYTELSQALKFEAQPPTQTFLLIDQKLGLVLAEPLFVEAGAATITSKDYFKKLTKKD